MLITESLKQQEEEIKVSPPSKPSETRKKIIDQRVNELINGLVEQSESPKEG